MPKIPATAQAVRHPNKPFFMMNNKTLLELGILAGKTLKCYYICQKDIVAIMVEVPTIRGKTEIDVDSAYFPGNVPEVVSFDQYCKKQQIVYHWL